MKWLDGFVSGCIVCPLAILAILEITGHWHHYIGLYCVW